MTTYKVVVDGSNIATEGRTMPSLSQLDEAVRSFIEENPGADVLVIVDSTFPNRIDRSEQPVFEAAYMAGEIITPPAGTVGRGDAFILKVADKLNATIFSNDSFQEFHGTYDWLFAKDRLVGGKPIPGLGWVFTDRVPVRGPRSREAVRDSKRGQVRIGSPEALKPMPVPKAPPPVLVRRNAEKPIEEIIAEVAATPDPRDGRGSRDGRDRDGRKKKRRGRGGERAEENGGRDRADVTDTPAITNDSDADGVGKKRRKRRKGGRSEGENGTAPTAALEAVNPSLTFINFIAAHGIGSEVTGVVERYSSHGMYIDVDGAVGYVPLSGLAEPMPRSAKEVIRKGETARWVVKSFDSTRRGIELALIGSPSAATVALPEPVAAKAVTKGRVSKKAAAAAAALVAAAASAHAEMAVAAPERAVRRSGGRKTVSPPTPVVDSAVAAAPEKSVASVRRRGAKAFPPVVSPPVVARTVSPTVSSTVSSTVVVPPPAVAAGPRKNPARKAAVRSVGDVVTRGAASVGKAAGRGTKAPTARAVPKAVASSPVTKRSTKAAVSVQAAPVKQVVSKKSVKPTPVAAPVVAVKKSAAAPAAKAVKAVKAPAAKAVNAAKAVKATAAKAPAAKVVRSAKAVKAPAAKAVKAVKAVKAAKAALPVKARPAAKKR